MLIVYIPSHSVLLTVMNTILEIPKVTVSEREVVIENIIAIIIALIAFSGFAFSLIKWWKKSNEDFTKFKTETNLKILEIEARISGVESTIKSELKVIVNKLELNQRENREGRKALYERQEQSQQIFFDQLLKMVSLNYRNGKDR